MFKFGTPLLPIKPQVNFKPGYGFNESVPKEWTFTQDNGNELKWTDIGTNINGFADNSMHVNGTAHVAQDYHWDDLASKCQREYGVLYADGSSETKLSRADAHEFLYDDSQEPSTAASVEVCEAYLCTTQLTEQICSFLSEPQDTVTGRKTATSVLNTGWMVQLVLSLTHMLH